MVLYQCLRCGDLFECKRDIIRHYSKKKLCDYSQNGEDFDKEFCLENIHLSKCTNLKVCTICGKEFERSNNRKRHMITCKQKQIMNEYKDFYNRGMSTGGNVYININNGTIVNNYNTKNNYNFTNCNFNVNAYSKTDYKPFIEKLENMKNFKIGDIIKLIHFDKEHPENHNLYISNTRTKQIKVLNNDKFQNYDSGQNGLEKIFLTTIDKLTSLNSEKISAMTEKLYMMYMNGNKYTQSEILKQINNTLYNFKDIPLETFAKK